MMALSFAGCATSENGQPASEEPPQIPPESSFVMNLDDFASQNTKSLIPGSKGQIVEQVSLSPSYGAPSGSGKYAPGDRKNWGFAAFNVGFWNALVIVGLAVPVASFGESFHHVPTRQPDRSWVWTYDVTVQKAVFTAELHGRYTDSGVRWDMYITRQGEYSDFLWYYGESNLAATQDYWILKNKPSDPTDLLQIDWHRNPAGGTSDIRYTNIVPGGPENGGYIFHEVTTDSPFNLSYDIYNKGKDNHTNIEWSNATKAGRVKDPLHFGDNQWYCWDSDLADTPCP
jgi:hypothetical protein